MSRRHPRLSIGPLEAWLNARFTNTDPSADRQLDGRLAARRIGELVGVDRVVVQRWRADGVPLYAADRAAIYAGTHPLAIWPDFHTIASEAPVTIVFHIDHHNDDERRALDAEAAPTLNVHLAGAAQLFDALGIARSPCDEIDASELLHRLETAAAPDDNPTLARRLRTLRAVAGAAQRVGRDVAWDQLDGEDAGAAPSPPGPTRPAASTTVPSPWTTTSPKRPAHITAAGAPPGTDAFIVGRLAPSRHCAGTWMPRGDVTPPCFNPNHGRQRRPDVPALVGCRHQHVEPRSGAMTDEPNSRSLRPGIVLLHRDGSIAMIKRRKVDDSGWWLASDCGGIADRVLDGPDWVVLTKRQLRVVFEETTTETDGPQFMMSDIYVCEGWWHPNVKAGQVHGHPDQPGRSFSAATHRLCEPVYTKREARRDE